MTSHPLISIPDKRRLSIFVALFALTLLVSAILLASGEPLSTGAAPAAILSYEFAGTTAKATEILGSWDAEAKAAAGFSLGLDYVYLLLYSTTIALAIVWLATKNDFTGFLLLAANILAWALWLAALLDAVENAALVTMLLNTPADPLPAIAFVCAALKFLLIAAGLLFVVLATLYCLVRSTLTKQH